MNTQTNTPDPMPLDMVDEITRQIRDLEADLAGWVAAARCEGASWAHIASALKVTRQAAQQRYGRR